MDLSLITNPELQIGIDVLARIIQLGHRHGISVFSLIQKTVNMKFID